MPTVSLPVPGELLVFLFSPNNSCIDSLFLKFSKFATVYVGFVIYVSLFFFSPQIPASILALNQSFQENFLQLLSNWLQSYV